MTTPSQRNQWNSTLHPVFFPSLKVALLLLHGGFPKGSLQLLIELCVDPDRETTTITVKTAQTATTLETTSRFISSPGVLLRTLSQITLNLRCAFFLKSAKQMPAVSVGPHGLVGI